MSDTLVESRAPTDNLVRARHDIGTIELRADDDSSGRTLFGHFAVFNRWTEIDSWYEGRFLERIAPGAFAATFAERADKIRILYDHGHDPSIGNKPLAAPAVLREDKTGAYYEAELFDEDYVTQLLPALRTGQLGASFRFRVTDEDWHEPKSATKANPGKLPERTITAVDLYEFGPVTFPAYSDATAGVRSGSDHFIERLLADANVLQRYIERAGPRVAAQFLASLPTLGRSDEPAGDPGTHTSDSAADGADDDSRSDLDAADEPASDATENPEETAVGQTEDNRQRIAQALARFGHHQKET